jgi:hypothetical protein
MPGPLRGLAGVVHVARDRSTPPPAVVGRYDLAPFSRLAGERKRAIDAWTRARVPQRVLAGFDQPLGG